MELVDVSTNFVSADGESFTEAMNVWLEKPQVVSRRLCGCVLYNDFFELENDGGFRKTCRMSNNEHAILEHRPDMDVSSWKGTDLERNFQCLSDTARKPDDLWDPHDYLNEYMPSILKYFENVLDANNLNEIKQKRMKRELPRITLQLRKLLPRQLGKMKAMMELVLTCENEKCSVSYLFIPLHSDMKKHGNDKKHCLGIYGIKFITSENHREGTMHLYVDSSSLVSQDSMSGTLLASPQWLETSLLAKLKSWAEENRQSSRSEPDHEEFNYNSIHLLSLEEYNKLYNELKDKYSTYLIKMWPENTDPQKFIYEDIGIATYIILTWKRKKLGKTVTFIDVGCGNGLLVYLLNQEGYKGKGIDIRRRKIWDVFGDQADLQELSLLPNETIFHFDWIIGNHSDELTPWIPVIAARSRANYFNLPCCFYTFQGKFQRHKTKETQYRQYLNFVAEIGRQCNFVIEEDKLRIPSTKKICHVGWNQSNQPTGTDHGLEVNLNKVLKSNSCTVILKNAVHIGEDGITETSHRSVVGDAPETDVYKPRESSIAVKNCTKVDMGVRNTIVLKVFTELLNSEKQEDIHLETSNLTSKGFVSSDWNPGGSIPLQNVVNMFDSSCLAELKSQCGGIKTLLRNYGHIFKVVKGRVSLKCYGDPAEISRQQQKSSREGKASRKKQFRKTKACWFDSHHPQGCLLTAEECDFIHSSEHVETI